MQNKILDLGIVLTRVDYGEADRIITFITPEHGKVALIAKGVRRPKSKLAGGVELFSVSEISFLPGRRDVGTLISSRLQVHFGQIVKDMARTTTAYDIIKSINRATEDNPEAAYFNLLKTSLEALNDASVEAALTQLWFNMQLLKLAGHAPNLFTDGSQNKLLSNQKYDFDFEQMCFVVSNGGKGSFNADKVKFLRLSASAERPHLLARVKNGENLTRSTYGLVQSMVSGHIRT